MHSLFQNIIDGFVGNIGHKNGMTPDMALNGSRTGGGWEKCDKPITDKEVWGSYDADAPETCIYCGGQKVVTSRYKTWQFMSCRRCGAKTSRPIRDGIVITAEEEFEEDQND